MIALPVSGVLADEISWESVFYFFGTLGVIWFIFWAYLCYDSPASHPRIIEVREYFLRKSKAVDHVYILKRACVSSL